MMGSGGSCGGGLQRGHLLSLPIVGGCGVLGLELICCFADFFSFLFLV